MAAQDGWIQAKFKVKSGTDVRRFQTALRKIYRGIGEDEDVAYVLNQTEDIICGHDPEVARRSGSLRGTGITKEN